MSEMVRCDERAYPEALTNIKDKPKQLYYIGDETLLQTRCVAICGSRRCTPYGVEVAKRVAKACADAGLTVVSGMAMGIDAAAHRGALDAGGKTIAVLGCGVDVCYPRSNRNLYEEIREKGLIVSEYADGSGPVSYNFPRRNRIISGLSQAVVVAEAANRSGALITAEKAIEQGRNVYAVPGSILSNNSFGCNKLIQDGAIMLMDAWQVAREMGIDPLEGKEVAPGLGEDENRIYQIIRRCGAVSMERLYAETLMTPQLVNGLVTMLEIKGLVVTSMNEVFISKLDIDTSSELWKNENE